MSADTSLSVMNYEFAHLNLYADEEALCFSIPELFLENMYIENEDVVSQYNSSIWTDVTGYSDMEDFSFDFLRMKKIGSPAGMEGYGRFYRSLQ